ncbi:MAG TPA: GNAT family N-acetyltransferase [Chloroflexia bacterium]|jgi:GNAT superfamily N-acetyltransferase|nr:GNAT family N-acetyltransferase [Chloroflexia bacterium]
MGDSPLAVGDTGSLSLEQISKALNAGFSGYFVPVNFTADSLAAFCRQYGIDLSQSLVVVPRSGEERGPAGVTLLGLREDRGWCGGFGIVPEYRGTGASRLLLDALVERCRELELSSLQLEVLTQNERAIKLYERRGFHRRRELVVLRGDARMVLGQIAQAEQDSATPARASGDTEGRHVRRLSPAEVVALMVGGRWGATHPPSWQRDWATLLNLTGIRGLVCESSAGAVGALLYQAKAGTSQINIGALAFSDPAAGHALLAHAYNDYKASVPDVENTGLADAASTGSNSANSKDHFFILNEPEGSPVLEMLTGLGMSAVARQYEMVLPLR